MVHSSGRVRLGALATGALVLALSGVACSGPGGDLVAVDPTPAPGTSSSPITADVSDDWQMVTAGVGNGGELWGQGCTSSGPYTVVRASDGARSIKVSAANYRGCSDGLDEISLAFPAGNPEELKIDGRRALLATEAEVWEDDRPDLPRGFVDLLVDADDSLAVRAQSTDVPRAELLEVAALAILDDDHRLAPRFDQLPSGFEVVGSVNATGEQAMEPLFSPGTDLVPGDDRTHTLGWSVGPADGVTPSSPVAGILAVPAGTVSFEALKLAHAIWTTDGSVDPIEIDGRPAVSVGDTVITEAEWGDQLIVTMESNDLAADGPPPTVDELVELAGAVRQADPTTWAGLVEEASGGPGLTANVGRREVARGEVGGVEWLLQTGDGIYTNVVDSCLKTGDGGTACATSEDGASDDDGETLRSAAMGTLGPDELPFALMVVPRSDPAVETRLTTGDRTVSAPFHPVPGSKNKVAVLVAEQGDRFECPDPGPGIGPDAGSDERPSPLVRYDAEGNALGCLGV